MKIRDFHIGMVFEYKGGIRYRCTDVGTRTISAVLFDVGHPIWLEGPPYMQDEILLDEKEIQKCYANSTDALQDAVDKAKEEIVPNFPLDVVRAMLNAKNTTMNREYPRKSLLRFEKLYDDDVAFPFAACKIDGAWRIECYLRFSGAMIQIDELAFALLQDAAE